MKKIKKQYKKDGFNVTEFEDGSISKILDGGIIPDEVKPDLPDLSTLEKKVSFIIDRLKLKEGFKQ